jgi:hypothetical protein
MPARPAASRGRCLRQVRQRELREVRVRAVSSPERTRPAGQLPAVTSTEQGIRAGGKR